MVYFKRVRNRYNAGAVNANVRCKVWFDRWCTTPISTPFFLRLSRLMKSYVPISLLREDEMIQSQASVVSTCVDFCIFMQELSKIIYESGVVL